VGRIEFVHVVAIVQARMGSSRYPGKVLKHLAGEPVLWHVVHRLRQSDRIGAIVVATSTELDDDAIESFCHERDISVIRGPEQNVLGRFRIAVEEFQPDVIVRVTGDAPLVDGGLIDRMVTRIEETGAGRCTVNPDLTSVHEGFSVLTRGAFERLVREAGRDPVAQEHVTGYFQKDQSFVTTAFVDIPEREQFEAPISVDTPDDLRFLTEVYRELDEPAGELDVGDVVDLLRRQPDLIDINKDVDRKGLRTESPTILIRCDGGSEYGWGHLSRSLAVAEPLRTTHGAEVHFAFRGDDSAADTISDREFRVHWFSDEEPEDRWMEKLFAEFDPDALILDVRSDLSPECLSKWRNDGLFVVSIDDISSRRLEADLVFYPPVPQVGEMDWSGHHGEVVSDWRWAVVNAEFDPADYRRSSGRSTVLVTMGGSDPHDMTHTAVQGLEEIRADFDAIVVIGDGYRYHDQLVDYLNESTLDPEIHRSSNDMPRLMAGADVAISAYGVTSFELAAMGVPSVQIGLTEDHVRAAKFLEREGMALCLGTYQSVEWKDITQATRTLLKCDEQRASMARSCRERVDNGGAKRIADRIIEELTTM
jgi:spore coat polysaccharide biosynthesis protein SpsF